MNKTNNIEITAIHCTAKPGTPTTYGVKDGTDHAVEVTLTGFVYTEGEEEPTETTVTLPLGEVTLINGESWGAPDNWISNNLLPRILELGDREAKAAYEAILSACAESGAQVTVTV